MAIKCNWQLHSLARPDPLTLFKWRHQTFTYTVPNSVHFCYSPHIPHQNDSRRIVSRQTTNVCRIPPLLWQSQLEIISFQERCAACPISIIAYALASFKMGTTSNNNSLVLSDDGQWVDKICTTSSLRASENRYSRSLPEAYITKTNTIFAKSAPGYSNYIDSSLLSTFFGINSLKIKHRLRTFVGRLCTISHNSSLFFPKYSASSAFLSAFQTSPWYPRGVRQRTIIIK